MQKEMRKTNPYFKILSRINDFFDIFISSALHLQLNTFQRNFFYLILRQSTALTDVMFYFDVTLDRNTQPLMT